jgi:hypothetical protein
MNVTEEQMKEWGYQQFIDNILHYFQMVFGASDFFCSFDTYQFDDYNKVVADRFDPEHKMKRRQEVFPKDCEKAFALGENLARLN